MSIMCSLSESRDIYVNDETLNEYQIPDVMAETE